MGAEELVAVALQRLREGLLPSQEPEQTWGGRGYGDNLCAVCAAPILSRKPEIETVGIGGATRFYHPACLDALSAARSLVHRSDPAVTNLIQAGAGLHSLDASR